MDLANLINHPEQLDRETLYELRGLLALYPYYQTARLLLLQNLYLLHDPTFNEELRDAALYITDRKVIFRLVEAGHYQLPKETAPKTAEGDKAKQGDRTISLIENFLDSLPEDEEQGKKKRKPTPADAAVDYVSYLLETEGGQEEEAGNDDTPQMKGQDLIDTFLNKEGGKITLKEEPEFKPDIADEERNDERSGGRNEERNGEPQEYEKDNREGYFTETLAKIYVKQGRYEKALEIIQRLNLNYPKKNSYFADQMRFLEKLILNDKAKSKANK